MTGGMYIGITAGTGSHLGNTDCKAKKTTLICITVLRVRFYNK